MFSFLKFLLLQESNEGVVTTFMKARIPTTAHKAVVDTIKKHAKQHKMDSVVKLSGTNKPLSGEQKKKYAEHLFKHPVELADDKTNSFAAHLKDLSARGYKTAHVFVGSDRAPEISRIAAHHNLNNNAGYIDKKGQKSFHFPGGIHVHQFGDERLNLDKPSSTEEHHLAKIHPTKMTPDQLKRSTSATRLETLANKGDWSAFKAYHTGVNSKHVKTLYDNIRSGSK